MYKELHKSNPNMFLPQRIVTNEQTLTLYTTEKDRVVRAWQYLYAHGCVGRTSPF